MTHKSTWKQLPRIVSLGEGAVSGIIPIVEELRLPRDPLIITTKTPKMVAGLEILRNFGKLCEILFPRLTGLCRIFYDFL